jgi:hypothetical protein
MLVSSQVSSTEKFSNSAVLAVGLSQASRLAGGIIQSMGAVFRGLIGAAVSALNEKHLAGPPEVWIFRGECWLRAPFRQRQVADIAMVISWPLSGKGTLACGNRRQRVKK